MLFCRGGADRYFALGLDTVHAGWRRGFRLDLGAHDLTSDHAQVCLLAWLLLGGAVTALVGRGST